MSPLQPLMAEAAVLDLGQTIAGYFAALPPSQRLSELSLFGDQVSRFRGQGMEYEESRAYQPGDELRHLNSRLMARTGKAATKLFQEERQAQWVILLDQRQAMRFATRGRLKAEQGLRLAGWLAWIAQRQAIRLQTVVINQQVQISPQLEGAHTYLAAMAQMNQPCPPLERPIEGQIEPKLIDVMQKLSLHWPAGCRIWLISDFAEWQPSNQTWLAQMHARWQLSALQVVDPAERQLPAQRDLRLAANGEVYRLNPEQQQAYNAWAQAMSPIPWLKAAGLDCYQFSTTDPLNQHPFLSASGRSL
ncbi:DUF58 domain-containing protein [Thiomicrospira microaerophila]|uniref:DUF58 domain-containing protein n=1 Tax=Thiomicrospira microaerophila TaxID=406020 RepID=UPI0006963D3B|nr:DUF58 domain-containing protein [Thiomicrospira microaerophila]